MPSSKATKSPESSRATGVRWTIFGLSCSTSALLYLHRYLFAFIKPYLASAWGLSNLQLGQIDGAFSLPYTVCQIPLALAADILGVHLVLSGLMLTWCGGLALTAWAPSARWMWFAQAALGAGESAVFPCFSRIARIWFPPKVRTTMLGAVGVTAARLGGLSSSLVFATLLLGAFGLGWRTAVWIVTAVGIVNLVAFAVFFRNSPRGHARVNEAEAELIEGGEPRRPAGEGLQLGRLWRGMSARSTINFGWLSLQLTLSAFADNIYSNWIPLFLVSVHHVPARSMGVLAALPLLGGAIAGLAGGALNDYFIARTGNRRWSRSGVGCGAKILAAILMLAAIRYDDRPYVFCCYLFFVKLCGDCSLATAWGAINDVGGRMSASVFALVNAISGSAQISAPLILGWVADHYGWHDVFLLVAGAYVLCALTWLAIDCTVPVFNEKVPDP